jgi:hypothetical protein
LGPHVVQLGLVQSSGCDCNVGLRSLGFLDTEPALCNGLRGLWLRSSVIVGRLSLIVGRLLMGAGLAGGSEGAVGGTLLGGLLCELIALRALSALGAALNA